MKKQWKLDNKGMTLLEVIVAFAIFAIAATILITGFNGALKVMGNSEKIKNASQENTGKLNAVGASALEEFEGLKNSEITTIPEKSSETTMLTLTFDKNKYAVPGRFYIATSTEKTDMDMKMFQPDGKDLVTPTIDKPVKKGDCTKEVEVPKRKEAYFNDSVDVGSMEGIFMYSDGNFHESAFTAVDKILGTTFTKAVIEESFKFTGNELQKNPNKHVQQFYFINKIPFVFSESTVKKAYAVRFLYLGSNNPEIEENALTLKVKYEYDWDTHKITDKVNEYGTNSFTLYSYENNNNTVLYLPKPLEIEAIGYVDGVSTSTSSKVTLQKGFYSIPSGTDIMKAAYDKTEQSRYFDDSSNGYYRPNMSEDELKKLKIDL